MEPETPIKKIEWQAFEYENIKKTKDWFWAVGIISISIIVTAVLFGNYLLAILIILSVFSLGMFSLRQPQLFNIKIDEKGITAHKNLYLFSSLESFWIEEQARTPRILVKSKKMLMPLIIIPINLEQVAIEDIHYVLSYFLHEEEMTEPALIHIMRFLGF